MQYKIETVLISQDEEKILKLKDLLSKYYMLNTPVVCDNMSSAIELLNNHIPSILFLDMEFSSILQNVKKPPFIIGLCDTIYTKRVKQFLNMGFFEIFYSPYEINELNMIMGKIFNILSSYSQMSVPKLKEVAESVSKYDISNNNNQECLFLMGKRSEGTVKIVFSDVLFLEKTGDYVTVNFIDESNKLFRGNLKSFQHKFPNDKFVKINHSVIVNVDKISNIYKNTVLLDDKHEFDISRTFKKNLKKVLNI